MKNLKPYEFDNSLIQLILQRFEHISHFHDYQFKLSENTWLQYLKYHQSIHS